MAVLEDLILGGGAVLTTGVLLPEVLPGFPGPWRQILTSVSALPSIVPDGEDHIEAAALRSGCRRQGLQVGTIDALIARICLRHGLSLLTPDRDFREIARLYPLTLFPTR